MHPFGGTAGHARHGAVGARRRHDLPSCTRSRTCRLAADLAGRCSPGRGQQQAVAEAAAAALGTGRAGSTRWHARHVGPSPRTGGRPRRAGPPHRGFLSERRAGSEVREPPRSYASSAGTSPRLRLDWPVAAIASVAALADGARALRRAARVAGRRARTGAHRRRRAAAQLPLRRGAPPQRSAARHRGPQAPPQGGPALGPARDPRPPPGPRRGPGLHPRALGHRPRAPAQRAARACCGWIWRTSSRRSPPVACSACFGPRATTRRSRTSSPASPPTSCPSTSGTVVHAAAAAAPVPAAFRLGRAARDTPPSPGGSDVSRARQPRGFPSGPAPERARGRAGPALHALRRRPHLLGPAFGPARLGTGRVRG